MTENSNQGNHRMVKSVLVVSVKPVSIRHFHTSKNAAGIKVQRAGSWKVHTVTLGNLTLIHVIPWKANRTCYCRKISRKDKVHSKRGIYTVWNHPTFNVIKLLHHHIFPRTTATHSSCNDLNAWLHRKIKFTFRQFSKSLMNKLFRIGHCWFRSKLEYGYFLKWPIWWFHR